MRTDIRRVVVFIVIFVLWIVFLIFPSFAEKEEIYNKNVVIFFDKDFPGGNSSNLLLWYSTKLKEMGVNVTVGDAKAISSSEFLSKKRFDTLILPLGYNIPFEAEYSICNFLAEGGNVITGTLPACGLKYHSENNSWEYISFGQPGWRTYKHSEFQIRFLSWESAQRSLKTTLNINSVIPSFLQERLPQNVGPFDAKYGLPDKMNLYMDSGGERHDFDASGGRNVETAANIILPIYLLPSGEPTDFIAYRYHSNYFNGSTLVILGNLGNELLNSPSAKDILYACLKICEIKFPGEEEPSYYERLIKLQKEVSDFGKLFIETYYPLRDLSFYNYYRNDKTTFQQLKEKMVFCEDALSYIMTEKRAIDEILLSDTDKSGQDERRKKLLGKIEEEKQKFQDIKKEINTSIKVIKYPQEVKIKNPLGEIVIAPGLTYPMGLYMLRNGFFQTLKELGGNTFHPQLECNYIYNYLEDPIVKKNREDVKFDLFFMSDPYLSLIFPSQGHFNPVTGELKETERKVYNYELFEQRVKGFVEKWKDIPILRYWTYKENGLGCDFWGEQAKEEYQQELKEKYKDIKNLNQRWETNYTDFNEIKLPVKQPVTVSEHSNWEDWSKYREKRYAYALQFAYDCFKKYDKKTPVSHLVSASLIEFPLHGANFYQFTKAQDINGLDGINGVPPVNEWVWYDLNVGKPVLTAEWGAFYRPPKDILVGRAVLSEEAWSLISGGAVGLNIWIWSWHGFEGNFVDTTGLPTLYGWELKSLASDFKKFDHIILDGKRKQPETRILFSDTSRCHQSWGIWSAWGKSTFSSHVAATRNLYSLFLRTHQPARIIAEEAILEGTDLSDCTLLIVPEAEYLSEELQTKLINYVKNGGNLLLEGKSGKYDNYGHSIDLIFKEAGIIPSMVNKKEVILPGGKTFLVSKAELSFSPFPFFSDKGKVILSYASGEPAIVSVSLGKGKIIISGVPFGLDYEENAASLIMEEINKEVGIIPRYLCSDRDIIMREWEYKGDEYLICAYPKGKQLVNEFSLKIKGNYKVNDYLLGIEIPSKFDGEYTMIDGLINSPGGIVYQLKKKYSGRIFKSALSFSKGEEEVVSKLNSDSLPFKGFIYVNEPKMIEGFLFQTSIGPTGEGYLNVSNEKEKFFRRLEPGKEYYFPFKKMPLLVKCNSIHAIFPLAIDLEIEETPIRPISSVCSFQKEGNNIFLSNGLVRLKISLEEGGSIVEYSTLPDEINHLATLGRTSAMGITENQGSYPGSFYNRPFSYEVIKNDAEEIKLLLKMNQPFNNLFLEKIVTIKKNWSKVNLEIKEYNYSDASVPLTLHLHPELNIGGIADRWDRFFIPTKDELKSIPYVQNVGRDYFTPNEGWAGCCDMQEKIAYISSFSLEEVNTVYIWFGENYYNIELFTPEIKVLPKDAISLNVELFLIKGISGIDNFKQGIASYIYLPGIYFLQDKEIKGRVEIGSACLERTKLNGIISIIKDGKEIKQLGKFNKEVSLEQPLEENFSFTAKEFPDGEYQISLCIYNENGEEILVAKKKFFLIGEEKIENLKVYEEFKRKINQLMEKYPSKYNELFDIYVLLEEFHVTIEENNKEEIPIKREKIEQLLQKIDK